MTKEQSSRFVAYSEFHLQFWSNPLCLNDIEHSSTDLDTLVYI